MRAFVFLIIIFFFVSCNTPKLIFGHYISDCYFSGRPQYDINIRADSTYTIKYGGLSGSNFEGTWKTKKDTIFLLDNNKKGREKLDYSEDVWDFNGKQKEDMVKYFKFLDSPIRCLIKKNYLIQIPYDVPYNNKGRIFKICK